MPAEYTAFALSRAAHRSRTLDAILDRLRENGFEHLALVIDRALAPPSGPLSRADVLTMLGRPTDAKLTGFTRPIARATRQLSA